jgi:sulfate permease, SulP family
LARQWARNGLAPATTAVFWFQLERQGVAVVGEMSGNLLQFRLPPFDYKQLIDSIPLAFVTAAVITVQSAATTRTFPAARSKRVGKSRFYRHWRSQSAGRFCRNICRRREPALNRNRRGIRGRTKFAGLTAAVPQSALAGTLMFVAIKLVRAREILSVLRRAFGEFLLILVTFAAVILLPIATGVAAGIVLSLLHGMWSMIRPQLIELERVPGTSIWWPPGAGHNGERIDGVLIIAFQAPLSFLNAYKMACAAFCASATRRQN